MHGKKVSIDTGDGPVALQIPRALDAASLQDGHVYYIRGTTSGASIVAGSITRADTPVATSSGADQQRFQRVLTALSAERPTLLAMPGVLDARAGYKYVDGWSTHTPAVVVTYDPSHPKPAVPNAISGIPVDLRPGTPVERLLASSALTPEWVRDQLNVEPLAVPGWELREQDGPLSAALQAAAAKTTTLLKYVAPPGASLDEITDTFDLVCHSSPDAGWPELHQFLSSAKRSLTIAMYDFTAPHIAKALVADTELESLTLVLDPGESLSAPGTSSSKNPKAFDQHETTIVDSLKDTFKKHLTFAWAAVKRTGKTTQGIFPSAYHIKVAIADGKSTWLSSGNWQSSNQPDLPQLTPTTAQLSTLFATFNREWHLIATSAKLAKLFETFIRWDRTQAAKVQVHPLSLALPEVTIEAIPALAAALPRVHPPLRLHNKYTIQPLLTPDNYLEHLTALVKEAKVSLRIQNQYIKLPARGGQDFIDFLALLLAKSRALKSKFQVIVRDLPDLAEQLDALEHFGFDMDQFKRQANTHTKGVIVDDHTVLIGSHNWSNQGVLENRDASLIIRDPKVAGFYAALFDHDWQNLAHQRTPVGAATGLTTSLNWSEYLS